jgi:hypothetical protein
MRCPIHATDKIRRNVRANGIMIQSAPAPPLDTHSKSGIGDAVEESAPGNCDLAGAFAEYFPAPAHNEIRTGLHFGILSLAVNAFSRVQNRYEHLKGAFRALMRPLKMLLSHFV